MLDNQTPFHAGELAAQERAGAGDIATRAAPFIRDHLPDQHRTFYRAQPFLVAASEDAAGCIWATIIEGDDGFVDSPDDRTLTLATTMDRQDPLFDAFAQNADVGIIGIEFATRRRNRLSGRIQQTETGFTIDVRQSFGNCPKYINERTWWRAVEEEVPQAIASTQLSAGQTQFINTVDTLFIGSGRNGPQDAVSNGYDASHRGGAPGFVSVVEPTRLRIPDYAGNNFFNTIGNLTEDPRVGLLFVDFSTGSLLHVTGRAKVNWAPEEARDPTILREIEVEIEAIVERRGALSIRWSEAPATMTKLVVKKKVKEAESITSFVLAPADKTALAPFRAGQHLAIAFEIDGHKSKIERTYSLSGSTGDPHYRISVKREADGIGSRFLHDHMHVGDVLEVKPPAGDFVIPDDVKPLVLVSAGVGLTPMLAMLHQAATDGRHRLVWYVHGTRNGRQHAFRSEVDDLVLANPNAKKAVFYSAPDDRDLLGRDFDAEGRISADDLLSLGAGPNALYMLCGPLSFMTGLKTGLEHAGVSSNQIQFETFGT